MDNVTEKAELLKQIKGRASEGEPVGGLIERYFDLFEFTMEAQEVLEEVLLSRRLANRDAALFALVFFGKRIGYEVDALLIHHQADPDVDALNLDSVSYLGEMAYNGSGTAARILYLLTFDRDWMEEYSDVAFHAEDTHAMQLGSTDEPIIEKIRAFWLSKATKSQP